MTGEGQRCSRLIIVCSGKIDRGVPLFSGTLMVEIGNIKEVRSKIYISHTKCD